MSFPEHTITVKHHSEDRYTVVSGGFIYFRNQDKSVSSRLLDRGERLTAAEIGEAEEIGNTIIYR